MGFLNKIQESSEVTRRDFVKVSAAATAALAASGALAGCSNGVEEVDNSLAATGEEDAVTGEWVTAACWHNCGGRCLNKALVKDGVVLRQKTDDTHDDSSDYPQQRGCLRGRSQRQQVFSAQRIKYPMKRKNWSPGGGAAANGDLRGKDEWERISWDEAIKLCADEFKRVYNDYGPQAVYCDGYAGMVPLNNVLNAMGGYLSMECTDSYGTWAMSTTALGLSWAGCAPDGSMGANDRFDLVNAETIVIYGANPAWAAGGTSTSYYLRAKKAGVNFVSVGPSYNVTAQVLDARWVQVRPGTDTPFLLAVAYVMLRDDSEADPLIDWDFLNRCTVGFDMDHLPEDAKIQECFKSYVLGEYDGIPKTPEWASEYCGTSVDDIEWFAHLVGCQNKVMLLHSYAAGRCHGAENVPQLFMTVGAMGGHMGKSGHATGSTYHAISGNGGPRLVSWGLDDSLSTPETATNPCPLVIPAGILNKSLVEGRFFNTSGGYAAGMMNLAQPGEWVDIDVKLFFAPMSNFIQSRTDANMSVKAHRKAETCIAVCYCFNPTAQYADIVLPCCTLWEDPAPLTGSFMLQSSFCGKEGIILPQKVIDPLYESKTDYEIACLMADALGLDTSAIFRRTPVEANLALIAEATVVGEDGVTPEPLVAIDEEDLAYFKEHYGDATCDLQDGKIHLRDFAETGIYQVERQEGDQHTFIAYQAYREDPEANPLPSASGKLEIYCQAKADGLNAPGFTDYEFKPYPHYIEPESGYVTTFSDWKGKVKGKYPYQVFNPHYLRRAHTTLDNLPWLREAFANPVYLNAEDAKEKGIEDGDTVVLFNDGGKILRQATVIESIMPGCIALPHGPWLKIDDETGVDFGGNENVLTVTLDNQRSLYLGAYNSTVVDFEKWTGTELQPDAETEPCVMPAL